MRGMEPNKDVDVLGAEGDGMEYKPKPVIVTSFSTSGSADGDADLGFVSDGPSGDPPAYGTSLLLPAVQQGPPEDEGFDFSGNGKSGPVDPDPYSSGSATEGPKDDPWIPILMPSPPGPIGPGDAGSEAFPAGGDGLEGFY